MEIIKNTLEISNFKERAESTFSNLVKAVIDIDKGLLVVDAELHFDF